MQRSSFGANRNAKEGGELQGEPEGGLHEVELPEPRAGLLTHAAVLARHSHSSATSPTLRGKLVREAFLCQPPPPPPDDVGELPEPAVDAPTMRDRLAVHQETPACAGCHSLTDPIGLGLENFDGLGVFRAHENGATIDPSGSIDQVTLEDAAGLGAAVSEHPALKSCFVRNVYRFAVGRVERAEDEATLTSLIERFEHDSTLEALLLELVTSPTMR